MADPATLQAWHARHYLHSEHEWAADAAGGPVIMARGEGCRLWDVNGREYLDAQAGLCLVNIGYGRPEPVAAASAQMSALPYYHSYWRFSNEPALELAAQLAELAPPGLERVYFTPGGAEAVEAAIKLAWLYHHSQGHPQRRKILCFTNAYHGATFGALSATGLAPHRDPFGPLLPGFVHLPPPDLFRGPWRAGADAGQRYADLVEAVILREGPETVAAFLAEPIPAVGGVTVPPEDYWSRVRRILDRYGVLLIADEVLTGFGRTGTLWCLSGYGVTADILVVAKGLTSGYLPLGATVLHHQVADALAGARVPFLHGHTYGGHPVACAVALANLRIIQDEGLTERAAAQGRYLRDALAATGNPHFGDIRGRGLLVGVELVQGGREAPPPAGRQLAVEVACLAAGVIIGVCPYTPVVLLTPPLTIDGNDIDQIVQTLDLEVRKILA